MLNARRAIHAARQIMTQKVSIHAADRLQFMGDDPLSHGVRRASAPKGRAFWEGQDPPLRGMTERCACEGWGGTVGDNGQVSVMWDFSGTLVRFL